ncbi:MAG: L-threonylcarbamoyladenylate synthase [Chloroflexota bacterium]
MKTKLLRADEPEAVAEAADLLRHGHLVVFPTDTLYGVGADAFNEAAVDRLYQAKQRDLAKGIPILLADVADLDRVVAEVTAEAGWLIERFWPGPLTLVLPKSDRLPANLSPNEGVAVRIPDHEIARQVIRAAGGAVATSSANVSGRPPARTVQEAMVALAGVVAAVLDGGPAERGVASTVLDCTVRPPRLLRAGPVDIDGQD